MHVQALPDERWEEVSSALATLCKDPCPPRDKRTASGGQGKRPPKSPAAAIQPQAAPQQLLPQFAQVAQAWPQQMMPQMAAYPQGAYAFQPMAQPAAGGQWASPQPQPAAAAARPAYTPPVCATCGKTGHVEATCWQTHPELRRPR